MVVVERRQLQCCGSAGKTMKLERSDIIDSQATRKGKGTSLKSAQKNLLRLMLERLLINVLANN